MSLINTITSRNKRKRDQLPVFIDGKPWHGNGAGKHRKTTLIEKAKTRYKHHDIPTRLSKSQLVRLINFHDQIVKLQRAFRQKHNGVKYIPVCDNCICPISLEPLTHPSFIRVNSVGFKRGFNLVTFADYLLANGKAIDPVDKEALSELDLKVIDKKLKQWGISKPSVAAIITAEAQNRYRNERDDAEHLEFLIDEFSDIITSCMDVLENYVGSLEFCLTSDYNCFHALFHSGQWLFQVSESGFARAIESIPTTRNTIDEEVSIVRFQEYMVRHLNSLPEMFAQRHILSRSAQLQVPVAVMLQSIRGNIGRGLPPPTTPESIVEMLSAALGVDLSELQWGPSLGDLD